MAVHYDCTYGMHADIKGGFSASQALMPGNCRYVLSREMAMEMTWLHLRSQTGLYVNSNKCMKVSSQPPKVSNGRKLGSMS